MGRVEARYEQNVRILSCGDQMSVPLSSNGSYWLPALPEEVCDKHAVNVP